MDWIETNHDFVGSVGADSLFALLPLGSERVPIGVKIEAVAVSGVAYYTRDHDAIRGDRTLGATWMSVEQYENIRSSEERELGSLKWEPLLEGQDLGPWSMIWTGKGGRVEIEVLEPPSPHTIAPWSGVVNQVGQRTGINRLMSNVHFIMKPPEFQRARVNKIIGNVMIATDQKAVMAFYSRYGRWVRYSGRFDRNAQKSWLEMLKSPTLE